ncbi:MAG: patatin-like phospholipase family protein [Nitrospirae bacterium]|nr:patatin-like phospholipase family protein [Nitrospirota bacterium]
MENLELTQNDKNAPVTLMLLGSGVRFTAYIGGLLAIEEKGLKVSKIIGASAGSIVGSLYALGRSPLEMKKIAMDVDLSLFRDKSLLSLWRGKGIYKGEYVRKWMDKMLEGRTFGDDFKLPLFVVATDIQNNTPFIFSQYTTPDVKVSDAVRFSIGIPWVFEYKHFTYNNSSHIFVDGNMLVKRVEDMFAKDGRPLILRSFSKETPIEKEEPLTFKRYFWKTFRMMMSAFDNERVSAEKWSNTILISCGNINMTNFGLTAYEKQFLFEQGYEQVRRYLEYKWKV